MIIHVSLYLFSFFLDSFPCTTFLHMVKPPPPPPFCMHYCISSWTLSLRKNPLHDRPCALTLIWNYNSKPEQTENCLQMHRKLAFTIWTWQKLLTFKTKNYKSSSNIALNVHTLPTGIFFKDCTHVCQDVQSAFSIPLKPEWYALRNKQQHMIICLLSIMWWRNKSLWSRDCCHVTSNLSWRSKLRWKTYQSII